MRILHLDIDTLRSDHLGCYGYQRNTSPNIDGLASRSVRFNRCHVSDAPCLPSRSAFFSGKFGIHTHAINHGGACADPVIDPTVRVFDTTGNFYSFPMALAKNGYYTASISPFAERHSAWWFYFGFREMYNTGRTGNENAHEVYPYAEEWLNKHVKNENWYLHVNMWDPHRPYTAPEEFKKMFENEPLPSWITEEKIRQDHGSYGPWGAKDMDGFRDSAFEIRSLDDYRTWINGYDAGIRYADHYVGKIINILRQNGVYDDTLIFLSSDHGENQGELNIYGDHQTADYITSRVPFLIKMPGQTASRQDNGLHYQGDVGATILELVGATVPPAWDFKSFAQDFKEGKERSRDHLVMSHCAHACQRSVCFDNWMLIKTFHTGFHPYPEYMLFDIQKDPHELVNLAPQRPAVVKKGLALLGKWHKEMMKTSISKTDPLKVVLAEGGAFHINNSHIDRFAKRLEATGRKEYADVIRKQKGKPVKGAAKNKKGKGVTA